MQQSDKLDDVDDNIVVPVVTFGALNGLVTPVSDVLLSGGDRGKTTQTESPD